MNKKLAILGGTPLLKSPLPEVHHIDKKEEKNAIQVIRTGKLSGFVAKNTEEFLGGHWVKKLEEKFCEYFGSRYAISMNSATSALYASVYALGICPADEVIVAPYTMSASATAILACSGIPVFVDVDINNYCIDADKIEAAVTSKTKAIIVVHLFGNCARMDKILSIAKRHSLRVIEDCAQSPGAVFQGRLTGTFGDVGVFSLNRHKAIQTGEGGVAITNNQELALKLRLIRNHSEAVIDQMKNSADFNLIGWNYKMTEIEAAIGVAQLGKLNRLNALRIRNAEYLACKLKNFSWLITNKPIKQSISVYYRYPFRYVKDKLGVQRSTLAQAMAKEGFPLNEGYVKPIYLQSIYSNKSDSGANVPYLSGIYKSQHKYRAGFCPVAERLYYEELLLSGITNIARSLKDIDLFVLAFKKISDNADSLLAYEEKT